MVERVKVGTYKVRGEHFLSLEVDDDQGEVHGYGITVELAKELQGQLAHFIELAERDEFYARIYGKKG